MDTTLPAVTVIVPTTYDRKVFNERILNNYLRQDYEDKTILFDYKEDSIGKKLNRMCGEAIGTILLRMDSDDQYSDDWITRSVEALIKNKADIVGLSQFNLYKPETDAFYQYTYLTTKDSYVCGASMCFRRSFWERNPFHDRSNGEDNMFLQGLYNKPVVFAHGYLEGFLATIHQGNTCRKILDNPTYRRLEEVEEVVLKERWGI